MGLFREERVVYKPVEEVDLGPNSDHVYLRANVKDQSQALVYYLPHLFLDFLVHRKTPQLVSDAEIEEPPLFVPLHPCEGYVIILNSVPCIIAAIFWTRTGVQPKSNAPQIVNVTKITWFKHSGTIDNFSEKLKELEVKCIDSDLSPPEQVQQATNCLPIGSETMLNASKPSFRRWTILDYSRAYSSREITPRMVAERFVAAVYKSARPPLEMSFFINYNVEDILKQANESTLRYERGQPISVLDGIPIAIKDEIDCSPYPTTGGTKWLHKVRPCKDDACCVKRLRLCGAILVGKTNMHELGAGTSGINPHYGGTRNPYDINKISGGSSSGSAAVVAAGLCPVALGVDGGGSVRMPAALCGVVGLKPSFGRMPHSGVLPLNWTVGMVGILAGTIADAFIVFYHLNIHRYAAMSGRLPSDQPSSTIQPRLYFPLLTSKPISGVKLAKYSEWFNDCSDDIRTCCSQSLNKLEKHYGWKIVEVTIPEIEAMRLAHYLTIGSECTTSLGSHLENLDPAELGWDARVALSVYGSFSSKEYLKAQKIRNRQMQFHMKIFAEADVIVSPTTGVTAYPLKDDALETGELDYINGAALVRFSIAGNFLGLPTVTVPVGYDKLGLPIGLQFIGRPWSEASLIQIASAMQALCISDYRKPAVFYDLLSRDQVRTSHEDCP
ncbi:Fatty acid amide hydrolase [Morella rubra]|uniref:Fatty acid amide hydrolase n=1 Tax=Morella rubra TaxID=262757 RepID=A0A6A1VF59_9ROSI|nr:Fatty acid amide hydrolase [Morella rubra]